MNGELPETVISVVHTVERISLSWDLNKPQPGLRFPYLHVIAVSQSMVSLDGRGRNLCRRVSLDELRSALHLLTVLHCCAPCGMLRLSVHLIVM